MTGFELGLPSGFSLWRMVTVIVYGELEISQSVISAGRVWRRRRVKDFVKEAGNRVIFESEMKVYIPYRESGRRADRG